MSNKKSQEEVVAQFNKLRQDQRSLASKLSELQMDLNEHKLVIETLSEVAPDRKCFRMIGGVLVERTVKEVSPALESNKDKISKLIETLQSQLIEQGQQINAYMEKNNIQIKRGSGNNLDNEGVEAAADKKASGGSGVLVSSKA